MSSTLRSAVADGLKAKLHPHGLDLVSSLRASWYNEAVPQDLWLQGLRQGQASLVVVIGNSKALWDPFLDHLAASGWSCSTPDSSQSSAGGAAVSGSGPHCLEGVGAGTVDLPDPRGHPLDAYVVERVGKAVEDVRDDLGLDTQQFQVRWAHETTRERLVAVQRLGQASGLAYLHQGTHLSLHPTFGPWVAFRAAVIVDVEGPPGCSTILEGESVDEGSDSQGRPTLACPAGPEEMLRATEALVAVMAQGSGPYGPKPAPAKQGADGEVEGEGGRGGENGAGKEQLSAAAVATVEVRGEGGEEEESVHDEPWRQMVAVRDAFQVGREHRYPPEMIEYHYDRSPQSKERLEALVRNRRALAP